LKHENYYYYYSCWPTSAVVFYFWDWEFSQTLACQIEIVFTEICCQHVSIRYAQR